MLDLPAPAMLAASVGAPASTHAAAAQSATRANVLALLDSIGACTFAISATGLFHAWWGPRDGMAARVGSVALLALFAAWRAAFDREPARTTSGAQALRGSERVATTGGLAGAASSLDELDARSRSHRSAALHGVAWWLRHRGVRGALWVVLVSLAFAARPEAAALSLGGALWLSSARRGVAAACCLLAPAIAALAALEPAWIAPISALTRAIGSWCSDGRWAPQATAAAVLPIATSCACILLAFAWTRCRAVALIGLAAQAALWSAHLAWVGSRLRFPLSSGADGFALLPWVAGASALLAACTVAWMDGHAFRAPEERESNALDSAARAPRRRRLAPWLGAAAGAALAAGSLWSSIAPPTLAQPARVAVVNSGGLDWNRPRYGDYGLFDGGMFGLLPLYLERDGFAFETTQMAELGAGVLERARVVVLINLHETWSAQQRERLGEWVRDGGSLLVLGDHTNVFGLRDGLNSLLGDVGLSFRFDSAFHAREGWYGCVGVPLHPANLCAPESFAPSHGIGASLEHSSAWRPLLRAPFAFSDHGEPYNYMGSFLGNYACDEGEPHGDLDLIAWRPLGRGKIVVYGDTTAFQNTGIPASYARHVLPLFRWLASDLRWTEGHVARIALALGFLCACIGMLGAQVRGVFAPAACIAWACVAGGAQYVAARAEPPRLGDDVVVLDSSRFPWVGFYDAGMNSIFPVATNLERAGLLVQEWARCDWLDAQPQPRAVVMVAPQREIAPQRITRILEYLRGGGTVLLTVGGEHVGASRRLLDELGLEIEARPLGTRPRAQEAGAENLAPRLIDAWPLIAHSTKRSGAPLDPGIGVAQPLITDRGELLAAFVPVGDGGAIVIADSRFLSGSNIEDTWGNWPGNIAFLNALFRRFLRADPSSIEDRFTSPEKPR